LIGVIEEPITAGFWPIIELFDGNPMLTIDVIWVTPDDFAGSDRTFGEKALSADGAVEWLCADDVADKYAVADIFLSLSVLFFLFIF